LSATYSDAEASANWSIVHITAARTALGENPAAARCRGSVRPFRGGAESYRRLMARRGFAGTLWLSERTLIERLPGRSSALHLHAVERMQRIGMRDDAGAVWAISRR